MSDKEMVRLWCKLGEHHWDREAQRGKKPHNCPEHRPVIERRVQELWCENGEHHWERTGGRGKPSNCPEHRHEAITQTAPVATGTEPEVDNRDVRAQEKAAAEQPFPIELLADEEDRRIVDYINRELASGKRSAAAIGDLRKRRDEVTSRARRVERELMPV